ncbi:MAG: hypothetical protein KAX31_00370, partial [Thermoplasmata archaeon]|nr:hypothetical protein [Thermoplasmata archaeon]
EYEMWYTGIDGTGYRILYANSTDGITWNRHPVPVMTALPHGMYDDVRTHGCTVVHNTSGYYMWYTGYDGQSYRTLYATSPDGIEWRRIGLAINKGNAGEHDSTRAANPSVLIMNNETKVWYSAYSGVWRIHYTNLTSIDNKTDLRIQWTASTSTDVIYYEICRGNNLSEVTTWTTYRKVDGTLIIENRLGDENATNYYYRVRAVDKVGNTAECLYILGKVGVQIDASWGLISSAFYNGERAISEALNTIAWDCARCYHTTDPFPWKTNIPGRPSILNTLSTVNTSLGIWAHVNSPDVFATVGRVKNLTLTLHAGWNLVSYPYHETKTVQDALSGLPWDRVEAFDPGAEYDISPLIATDTMQPGEGYWIHLTADAIWEATNL